MPTLFVLNLLLLTRCAICSWIPYCTKLCYNTRHYCSRCNSYHGSYVYDRTRCCCIRHKSHDECTPGICSCRCEYSCCDDDEPYCYNCTCACCERNCCGCHLCAFSCCKRFRRCLTTCCCYHCKYAFIILRRILQRTSICSDWFGYHNQHIFS